jgi:hypothetical protein
MTQPDENEDFFKTFEFKGIEIKPLTYARRALVLSMVNLVEPTFMDLPSFIYGCICNERDLIKWRRTPEKFDIAVAKWIDEIKYSIQDCYEAGEVVGALIKHSNDGRATSNEDPTLDADPN